MISVISTLTDPSPHFTPKAAWSSEDLEHVKSVRVMVANHLLFETSDHMLIHHP